MLNHNGFDEVPREISIRTAWIPVKVDVHGLNAFDCCLVGTGSILINVDLSKLSSPGLCIRAGFGSSETTQGWVGGVFEFGIVIEPAPHEPTHSLRVIEP